LNPLKNSVKRFLLERFTICWKRRKKEREFVWRNISFEYCLDRKLQLQRYLPEACIRKVMGTDGADLTEVITEKPQIIVLIAIPLLIQTYGIFFITYFVALKIKLRFATAAPACMIATSNFFELAVAVAISLFGLHSGAALATVVGVLVEVPVMLSLVAFANKTKHWFEPTVQQHQA